MTVALRTAVVVGNPKAGSRTLASALRLARELVGEPELVGDLAELGGAVLDLHDERVSRLVKEVASYDVAVFASPTYKAALTGLLKAFLDRFPSDGLSDVAAVPLMLTVPVRGLYVHDATYDDATYDDPTYDDPTAYTSWLAVASPLVHALASRRTQTAGA